MKGEIENEHIEYTGYPDFVLQSNCPDCERIFYTRSYASFCPHCGAEDPLSRGNGVVCHRPPE